MRYLITCGPTREPIDAVRYISNRSSGRLGAALAMAARDAGHATTLLAGPGVNCDGLTGVALHRFESTADLADLLQTHFAECDRLIMAAAVADYRPVSRSAGKLPRASQRLTLELEPTPDLVAGLASQKRDGQRIVAFALEEPAEIQSRAAAKLKRKHVDAVVANPLDTMDAATIRPLLLTADGRCESPGTMTKGVFANWLIEMVDHLFGT